ncbi:uncharacterized protein LOC127419662 [Myxocyprinus asiaticus]|uniref:uncharacterized protein LOC127419662 n=1 Tax=Myxocyprinus asiaticus TaxID=70543 RepID=UPI00222190DF|nr:uncharacterized protein LOC127419662 [Myxocyprinus asiaticus]
MPAVRVVHFFSPCRDILRLGEVKNYLSCSNAKPVAATTTVAVATVTIPAVRDTSPTTSANASGQRNTINHQCNSAHASGQRHITNYQCPRQWSETHNQSPVQQCPRQQSETHHQLPVPTPAVRDTSPTTSAHASGQRHTINHQCNSAHASSQRHITNHQCQRQRSETHNQSPVQQCPRQQSETHHQPPVPTPAVRNTQSFTSATVPTPAVSQPKHLSFRTEAFVQESLPRGEQGTPSSNEELPIIKTPKQF